MKMPKIIMRLNEIHDYDRKLYCDYCILYLRCRGDIKRIDFPDHKFCPEFRDVIE